MRPTESSVVVGETEVSERGLVKRVYAEERRTEVVRGVEAFDFGGAFDAGRGGAGRGLVAWYLGGIKGRGSVHQTETHTTRDGVLFPLRHVQRPDDDPGEDGEEKIDQDRRDCSTPWSATTTSLSLSLSRKRGVQDVLQRM